MAEISSQLLEFKFKDVSCPISSFIDDGSQDMPEHKHTDQDGSRSEGTGRNAYIFTVKALFIDGIARGPNETWDNLYPQQYNLMLAALEDRSSGPLQHPERGEITCKPLKWTSSLSAEMRGGRVVDITFRETDDTTTVLSPAIESILTSGSLELDNTFSSLNPPIPSPIPDGSNADSMSGFCQDLSAIGDDTELPGKAGSIDNLISKLNNISDSFSSALGALQTFPLTIASNITSFINGQTIEVQVPLGNGSAKIQEKIALLIAALHSLKNNILTKDRVTSLYQTQVPMSLGQLAKVLRNDPQDLLKLNPILSGYQVPKFTTVEYYG